MLRSLINKINTIRQRRGSLKSLGTTSIIDPTAKFVHHQGIEIGDYCRIGPNCHLDGEGGLKINDGTILGSNITILTSTHRYDQTNYLPYDEYDDMRPVIIGRGCWIGWGAMIAPGVEIGDGAVVAMGAVVVKDVLPGSVVGGNPAIHIKNRSELDFINQAIANKSFYIKRKLENKLNRRPLTK